MTMALSLFIRMKLKIRHLRKHLLLKLKVFVLKIKKINLLYKFILVQEKLNISNYQKQEKKM